MKISYEPTFDDIVEPVVRFHFQGETYRRQKRNSALMSVAGAVAASWFCIRPSTPSGIALVVAGSTALGLFVHWVIYDREVRYRLRKYVRTELAGDPYGVSEYTIGAGTLDFTSRSVRLGFDLVDLQNISEDEERLELSFGRKGLCLIPLRAFASPEEKVAFLHALESGRAPRAAEPAP